MATVIKSHRLFWCVLLYIYVGFVQLAVEKKSLPQTCYPNFLKGVKGCYICDLLERFLKSRRGGLGENISGHEFGRFKTIFCVTKK